MKENKWTLLFTILITITLIKSINNNIQGKKKATIHFINVGHSDSTLIEQNGKFGLVDASENYLYAEHEVEKVNIDPSAGEKNQGKEDSDRTGESILRYLQALNITHLDFVIATHGHSDHIGGIPQIAYYFVDNETTYYYRDYTVTSEDTKHKDWANKKYYLAARNSMMKKGAKLIEVTDKKIEFYFGELKIEILNTDKDPLEAEKGENENSIVQFITVGKSKIFLAADMVEEDDKKLKDYIGKLDLLKLAHHGYSESSYEFISTTKPENVVIFSDNVLTHAIPIISYLRYELKSNVYYDTGSPKTSFDAINGAVKFGIYDDSVVLETKGYTVNIYYKGWYKWGKYWTYLLNGLLVKGWQDLSWSKGINRFYFSNDGIMATGWQKLKWEKGEDLFYFDPQDGYMLQNTCRIIDGKNCCFDENGVYIRS